ncbi:UPF0014 family [Pilobolus umbonatus]|nr:UPF0014 family [Pilobolus umbonatus]
MDDIPNLTWLNVGLASLFILINAGISLYLKLKLEKALLISSVRCIVQLTIMGKILNDVFEANNVYLVMLMTFTLIFLSSCETVYNKSEWSFNGMFPSVLITTAFTTMLIGIIGSRYAMNEKTFWAPDLFIPTMGLILGVTAGGVAVSLSICLDKIKEDQKVIETYLSYGASKWEACRMIAKESIKLALLPNINRMSIVGLITIPGAMTGQILSGAPIMNAVYYQQIITFMISAAETLCVVIVTYVSSTERAVNIGYSSESYRWLSTMLLIVRTD